MTIDRDDDVLDALFDAARGTPAPPDALIARVLADAERVQAETRAAAAPPARAGRRPGALAGALGRWIAALGGWPAVSGVTLAGVAGLALGFALPDVVDTWSGGQIWSLSGGAGTMPEMGALWDGTWEEGGDV
ncbi:hypothetical protein [Roseicyclus marinus]|uniref:hypothetical protein n=1 Tax=Roseicyclus marinus TaxID=2161673 RepID=UPI00240EC926|nr:hypothetical protein [Roseicyclus marinus]MDG3040617.1 hypothetical protein [Roseicyclus marinus]